MTLKAGAALVACVCALAAAHPGAQSRTVAQRAVDLILDAPAAANDVWPGFSLLARDWAIYASDAVYLYTRATPPPEFVRRGRVYVRNGTLADLKGTFALRYKLGDLTVTVIPAKRTPELTAEMLYHEAFHAFQHDTFTFAGNDQDPFVPSTAFTAEAAADIEIERRLLREAILATNDGDHEGARLAAGYRAARQTIGPAELVAAERIAERHEGLADYVEQHSLARALGRSDREAAKEVARRLAVPMKAFGGSPDERLVRTRAYGSGAALGILLDRAGVDWKMRARSEPLDVLLRERVLASGGEDVVIEDARRRYRFDNLVASRTPSWGSLGGMSISEFNTLAPHQLILELGPGAAISWSLGDAAAGGMHRPAPDVLLLPAIARLTVRDSVISATVGNRPVRLDSATAKTTTVVTILLRAEPRVDGRPLNVPLATSTAFRIEADDVVVTVSGATNLFNESGRLRVVPVRDGR